MIELLSDLIIELIRSFGYLAVFGLMFLESALIPVPSEVVMPFSGFVSQSGGLNFWMIVFWGTIGQLLGSIAIYLLGKFEGRHLLEKYGKYLFIKKKDIHHADRLFEKHGDQIVFFGRLLPVVRTFISLPAGVANMSFTKFILYSFLGILPWTLLFAWLGVKMGENWIMIKPYFHILDIIIVVLLTIFVGYKLMGKISARKRN